MAKCVKHVEKKLVKRVSNDEAAKLVATGKWNYASKSEWKRSLK